MNKNFKVIQIQGITGLLMVGFISTMVFCGFVALPVWIIKTTWNYMVASSFNIIPEIGFMQASLLWAVGALLVYSVARKYIKIGIAKEMPKTDITKTSIDIENVVEDLKKAELKAKEEQRTINNKQQIIKRK